MLIEPDDAVSVTVDAHTILAQIGNDGDVPVLCKTYGQAGRRRARAHDWCAEPSGLVHHLATYPAATQDDSSLRWRALPHGSARQFVETVVPTNIFDLVQDCFAFGQHRSMNASGALVQVCASVKLTH